MSTGQRRLTTHRRLPRPAVLVLVLACTLILGACQSGNSRHVTAVEGSRATATSHPGATTTTVTAAARPVSVDIPAIEVGAAIIEVGLEVDGAMEVPDFGLAGWYGGGPRPGDPGPAVVVAHVDSKAGPDVFFRLRELQPHDRITITDEDGTIHTFTVSHQEQVPKDQLPVERIWNETDGPVLRLVTCGGSFDRSIGHYRDNIIVYATALGA